MLYEGATARKDAEADERSRWLHILAGIVTNTDTPMARMLREKPGDVQRLGAGRRASTLRARVRSLRRYVLWLSTAYGVSFPSETAHLVDYLQVRLQVPSTKRGLKAAHQALRFCEEVTAVPEPRPALPGGSRDTHPGSPRSFWQHWKKRCVTLRLWYTIGSTPGGSSCSVGGHFGSLITGGSNLQISSSAAKVLWVN